MSQMSESSPTHQSSQMNASGGHAGPRQPPTQPRPQTVQSAGGEPASRPAEQLFPTQNFLSEDVRKTSIAALNQCLADTTVMYFQLKSAHWNVKGANFFQLHELFDEVAETLEGHIDELAERATALGGHARGTARIAAETSTLPRLSPEAIDERTLLERIARNLSALDAKLFEQMDVVEERKDLDTVDLLNEVSRDVSKSLWFVEAHLQGHPQPAGGETGQQSQQMGGQGQQSQRGQGQQQQIGGQGQQYGGHQQGQQPGQHQGGQRMGGQQAPQRTRPREQPGRRQQQVTGSSHQSSAPENQQPHAAKPPQ